MQLTPETLPKHELNGLPVRVVESTNRDLVGIGGRVVIETTNTLHVEDTESDGRVRQVPKRGTTFEFELAADASCVERVSQRTAGETSREDRTFVTVDGERLHSRPARRTETTGDSPWE